MIPVQMQVLYRDLRGMFFFFWELFRWISKIWIKSILSLPTGPNSIPELPDTLAGLIPSSSRPINSQWRPRTMHFNFENFFAWLRFRTLDMWDKVGWLTWEIGISWMLINILCTYRQIARKSLNKPGVFSSEMERSRGVDIKFDQDN